MTPETEIEREIAEALGWTSIRLAGGGALWGTNWRGCPPGTPHIVEPIPSYCSDLNAVAITRAALTEDERIKFAQELDWSAAATELINELDRPNWVHVYAIADAPALLQARAIHRILKARTKTI